MAKVAAPSPLPWEIPPKGGLSQGGRTWDPPCGFRRVNPPTLSSPLQEERVGNLANKLHTACWEVEAPPSSLEGGL